MAVQDDNLLNLLLAYSASHRARLLRQPEPATRIAIYMRDTFPNLRRALDDPNQVISNSTLATAIMLASLEIISPTAFGIEVPWQQHLGIAREIIAVRGGPQNMRSVALSNQVVNFLWSWFAYLDVLGSLSGGKGNAVSPLFGPTQFYVFHTDTNSHGYSTTNVEKRTNMRSIVSLASPADASDFWPKLQASPAPVIANG